MQKSGKKSAIFSGDGNRYVRHIGSKTAVNTMLTTPLGQNSHKNITLPPPKHF